MKILAQFGIFIRIIILNIGGKKANTQYKVYEKLIYTKYKIKKA
jgi:hypothetical protein